MAKRKASSVPGIGMQTKTVPDMMLLRALEGGIVDLHPLEIQRGFWKLDLGGAALPRARTRFHRRLAEAGFERQVAEEWEFGAESVWTAQGGGLVHASIDADGVGANTYADSPARAKELLCTVERIAKRTAPRRSGGDHVAVRFWHLGSDGPASFLRRVRCQRWQDIAENYPTIGPKIESLLSLQRPYEKGNFVFWHGPAGTGKTSALRALMRAWTDMDVEVITDPDVFLGSPEYFNAILIEPTDKESRSERRSRRGRLLVLEDAPDLIRAEQSAEVRGMLSKLLNISDGVLSHDLRLVLLATTHERGAVPASALTRPGRKLQVLEFARLNASQAKEWYERRQRGTPKGLRDASLAELYASLGSDAPEFESFGGIGFGAAAS